jgi:hypothetical protein
MKKVKKTTLKAIDILYQKVKEKEKQTKENAKKVLI